MKMFAVSVLLTHHNGVDLSMQTHLILVRSETEADAVSIAISEAMKINEGWAFNGTACVEVPRE